LYIVGFSANSFCESYIAYSCILTITANDNDANTTTGANY